MAATHASAKLIPIDDFNDFDDDGWTRMDSNLGHPWGPGVYDASSGAYNLSTASVVPGNGPGRGFMLSLWDESSDPFYSEGYVRTKFRIDTYDATAQILLRYSGDIDSGLYGYALGATAGRGFSFNRITNTASTRHIGVDGPTPEVGEEWWMEAGAVGNQLSLKAWRLGDLEPESPQLSFVDSTYSTGVFGLDANMNWSTNTPGIVNTTFDDVYFRTPSRIRG